MVASKILELTFSWRIGCILYTNTIERRPGMRNMYVPPASGVKKPLYLSLGGSKHLSLLWRLEPELWGIFLLRRKRREVLWCLAFQIIFDIRHAATLDNTSMILLRGYTDNSPSKTNRPLRQIALSDKSPSNTNSYETEERAICLQLGRIALLCRRDESPSSF